MSPYYAIRKSTDGKYYFNLYSENNEVVLTSETYYLKSSALNGIESAKKNSLLDSQYKRKISKRELNYFVLVAGNGEVIGTSEEYSSAYGMEEGIKTVKRIGPIAVTIDRT